ncbi:MAG TPA: hypothetical protein PKE69_11985 [Pyrinomonadaceae bacterium]|nr:hypothetical protein [Pyrinomonadaceae bacterium]
MGYSKITYFKLRSRLDAFQSMALTYCLNAETDEEAQARMDFIFKSLPTDELRNNVSSIQSLAAKADNNNGCPNHSPFLCNGECMPFPCPTD